MGVSEYDYFFSVHSLCSETLGNLFVFSTALFVICGNEDAMPGLLGLLINNAMDVTSFLSAITSVAARLEGDLAVIERIQAYEDLPPVSL